MRPVLEAWIRMIAAARAAGVPVIYTTPVSRADGADVVLLPTDLSTETGVPPLTNAVEGSPDDIGIHPDAVRPGQNMRRLGTIVLDEFGRAKRGTDQSGKQFGILFRPALPDREHLFSRPHQDIRDEM